VDGRARTASHAGLPAPASVDAAGDGGEEEEFGAEEDERAALGEHHAARA
jgi:hypothetical protein